MRWIFRSLIVLCLVGISGTTFVHTVVSEGEWIPDIPQTWSYEYWKEPNGTSFLNVTLGFPTLNHNVTGWGVVHHVNVGQLRTTNIEVWELNSTIGIPAFKHISHVYNLGELPVGIDYTFELYVWGWIFGTQRIRPWDVTGDGYVGIDDLVGIAAHFGTYPGHPAWDYIYDIIEDDFVEIDDIIASVDHFGDFV